MSDIERAVALLRQGELVAFPTETVYGLGADASNSAAVAKIFAAKGRPQDRPLAVLLQDSGQAAHWARDIPEAFWKLARTYWPGPLTIVLKRAPGVSDALTAGLDTIGLRVPNHPLALALLNTFGGAIAATSANRSGDASPTTAQAVHEALGATVRLILDGGLCAIGIESTVLDLSGTRPRILRAGAIGAANLADVFGEMPCTDGATTL
ncbi:MAG: L-threonylcarbamoyladenylate synthase [Candidatus Nitricoxidivorans perseverans]|uniref:L-threonylcarbamoyladenylate synthase n=1 Tax=Candidatus Nitricoxidivorans perseverans TaxID=2975601 RepID=A0AA49FN65_9PROT|nr:MAG: L-threonylcarbamoyladenylate synthase [Candidatus Nitricoxidivorans perseverans]